MILLQSGSQNFHTLDNCGDNNLSSGSKHRNSLRLNRTNDIFSGLLIRTDFEAV
jgi:hypothetical protein